MSEPTYRIKLVWDVLVPEDNVVVGAWDAEIYRISDDTLVRREWAKEPEQAEAFALAWIKRQMEIPVFITLYATEDGELCDPPAPVEPQSLRA